MAHWTALDRLRALAVLLMVQGHSFNVLLAESERAATWFRYHRVVHGLTAPMFLMGAGLAFGITTYRAWDQHVEGGPALKKRMKRYATLLVLGYALQVPGFSMSGALRVDLIAREMLLRVGPLQLIAVTLGLCQLTLMAVKHRGRFAWLVGATGAAIMICSPWVWNAELSQVVPLPFGTWLDRTHRSSFPLFPWASFVFVGVALAHPLVARDGKLQPGRWLPWTAAGLALSGVCYALYRLKVNPYGEHDFWNTSPIYTLFRMGAVFAVLGLAAIPSPPSGPDAKNTLFAVLARRSLVAYVVHLLILYGSPISPSMHKHIGATLALGDTTLVFSVVLALTLVVTVAWDQMHQRRPDTSRWVRVSLGLVCLVGFIR